MSPDKKPLGYLPRRLDVALFRTQGALGRLMVHRKLSTESSCRSLHPALSILPIGREMRQWTGSRPESILQDE